MIDKAYLLYLIFMGVFGWLCYRFGFVAGRIEELVKLVDFIIHDDSSEDPDPEKASR